MMDPDLAKEIQALCFNVSLRVLDSVRRVHPYNDEADAGFIAWNRQRTARYGHADQEVCIVMSEILNEGQS